VPVGEWTHIAATFDGTVRRTYINGMLDAEQRSGVSRVPLNTDPVTIGGDAAGAELFAGNIAAVRIWSAALSITEIRSNMIRLLERRPPELAAQWALEHNAADMFSTHSGTTVGTVAFDGSHSPAFVHDPLAIPRTAAEPVVNGCCASGEYSSLHVPVWYGLRYRPIDLVWANIVATDRDVFVCFRDLHVRTGSDAAPPYAMLYLDAANSGGFTPSEQHWRIGVSQSGEVIAEQGNGKGFTAAPMPVSVTAAAGLADITWSAEFRIPRSMLSTTGRLRMQFVHQRETVQETITAGPPIFSQLYRLNGPSSPSLRL
jgi:hypothetical protein